MRTFDIKIRFMEQRPWSRWFFEVREDCVGTFADQMSTLLGGTDVQLIEKREHLGDRDFMKFVQGLCMTQKIVGARDINAEKVG